MTSGSNTADQDHGNPHFLCIQDILQQDLQQLLIPKQNFYLHVSMTHHVKHKLICSSYKFQNDGYKINEAISVGGHVTRGTRVIELSLSVECVFAVMCK